MSRISSEMRPTKARAFRTFSCIQAETLAAITKTRFCRRENFVSHASFSNAAKDASYFPIQDISSRNTIVFAEPLMAAANASKALAQPSHFASGTPVATANRSQKWSISFWFVISESGASPAISTNRHFDSDAKCAISVDLPIRRRPDTATNDDVRFFHSAAKSIRLSSRPTNTAQPPLC